MEPEKCLMCGEMIPEGQQLCSGCMKEYDITPSDVEAAEELRDIAQVLSITASTDKNIQLSMEAILRIADRLERRKNSERLQTKSGTGQRQQARKESQVVQRLKLINQLAPHVLDASSIKERIEQRKERTGNGSSGNVGSGNMVVH